MTVMKKVFSIILAVSALLAGLTGCGTNEEPLAEDAVDLRYRVANEYNLDAISAKPITIVVKSSKPWTIRSYHPDWCIIEQEEGEGVDPELVHVGKGENTTVRVQYYDNDQLDDRIDYLEIASDGYIGKKVTIYQKGIAYMNIPEADIEGGLFVEKAGGELTITVKSNQDWTAKVVEGNWLTITEGASGTLDGEVKLTATENTGEKRYASVGLYDRHGEERAMIKVTQDGVQLDPATFELRASFDQLSTTLSVVANTKWVARKGSESDDWYTIENPDGHDGDGVLNITLTKNEKDALRKSFIVITTVAANPDDAVAEKEIVIKQAYEILPVRKAMDDDEMGAWGSDWANAPSYTKDYGTLFVAKSRLHNGSMPFGTYTFRWKDWQGGARIRHWFCFDESCELKFDIRPIDSKCSFDFNVAGDGNKPSISAYTAVDWNQPIEITFKFDPSGSEYCHVTYLVNGAEAGSFDTSASLLRSVKWGSKINMYVGCDQVSDKPTGQGVLEWYEYTAPMNWDE